MSYLSSSLNLCNVSPWALASRHFNDEPKRVEIQGVRHAHRLFFRRLEAEEDAERRGRMLHDYMAGVFQLEEWAAQTSDQSRRSLRNSYLRFLRGWMVDSNSVEGAVLKGWVESRLGLAPTFHREPICGLDSEAYFRYTADRARGHARTSAVHAQLDLLYEFTQEELNRRDPFRTHRTLFRGVHDFEEHRVLEDLGKDRVLLRLNNLNSFTADFERAWEFGTRVLEARVPLAKVFFQCDVLPIPLLKGEEEVMVVGGEYEVRVRTY